MKRTILSFIGMVAVWTKTGSEWWQQNVHKFIVTEISRVHFNPVELIEIKQTAQIQGKDFLNGLEVAQKQAVNARVGLIKKLLDDPGLEAWDFTDFLFHTAGSTFLRAFSTIYPIETSVGFELVWEASANHKISQQTAMVLKVLRAHEVSGVAPSELMKCLDYPQAELHLCAIRGGPGKSGTFKIFKPLEDADETINSEDELEMEQKKKNTLDMSDIFAQLLSTVHDFHAKAGCFHGSISSGKIWIHKTSKATEVRLAGYGGSYCPNNPVSATSNFHPKIQHSNSFLNTLLNKLTGNGPIPQEIENFKSPKFDQYRHQDHVDTGTALSEILELNQSELDESGELFKELQSVATALKEAKIGQSHLIAESRIRLRELKEKFGPRNKLAI